MSDQPSSSSVGIRVGAQTPVTVSSGFEQLAKAILPIRIPLPPKQNFCLYLGPRAVVETELEFSTFFNQPHTIAGWFMPQYTVGACHGPLFAGSGSQRYFVGQGDYRSGNALVSAMNLALGVSAQAGDPVLAVYAGSESRIYLAPTFKSGVWQHVAVVRQATSAGDVLILYVNGQKLAPVSINVHTTAVTQPDGTVQQLPSSKTVSATSDLPLPASLHGADLGKLVLGRSLHPTRSHTHAQAYGLLDDVAVFDHALTQAEINDLMSKKRLIGYETGLVAGWGFDTPSVGKILPAKLSGPINEENIPPNLTASSDRNSDADKWILDSPFIIAATTPVVRFPFAAGDAWRVVQGYCNPLTSHNGDTAAFCYDLTRAAGPSGNVPVNTVVGGYVYNYFNHPNPKAPREANTVNLYNDAIDLGITYMHLADNSLAPAVVDGDVAPADPTQWVQVWPNQRMILSGQRVGNDGPIANHLHLAGVDSFVSGLSVELASGTIPIAFENVEVYTAASGQWYTPLGPYIPRQTDQVRGK